MPKFAASLSLFMPTHIAQLVCEFAERCLHRSTVAGGNMHSVALRSDGSLVS